MSKTVKSPDLLSADYWNSTIRMSLSKFFILCVLNEQDLHGYDIAKEVVRRTEGCCAPQEGTIYPVLKQFTKGGLVTFTTETVSGRERKIYTITEKGREAFKIGLAEWMRITRVLEGCNTSGSNPA